MKNNTLKKQKIIVVADESFITFLKHCGATLSALLFASQPPLSRVRADLKPQDIIKLIILLLY